MKFVELVTITAKRRNRDSRKTVAEYEHMLTFMVEFLTKFESRGIKIAQVHSIHFMHQTTNWRLI